MINTSYDVFLYKEMLFRGCDVTAAYSGGKIPKNLHFEA